MPKPKNASFFVCGEHYLIVKK